MDRFPGLQKLTTYRPKQWSVTPPINRQLDQRTDSWRRQSSDNWQTLFRVLHAHTRARVVRMSIALRFVGRREHDAADRKYMNLSPITLRR